MRYPKNICAISANQGHSAEPVNAATFVLTWKHGKERDDMTDSTTSPRIAIIGAGFGGLGVAVRLRQAGFENFTLYERESAPGGTWYVNRYPGVGTDTESEIYRFSFLPYNWSQSHAPGHELLDYMSLVIEKYQLRPHIRLNTTVLAATWSEETASYTVHFADGSSDEAEVLISAVGLLSEPNWPDWPGLVEFPGEVMHSARWRSDVELTGKRVAVVGTGSTSAQIVPELAKIATEVVVFQRQPGWVLPKTVVSNKRSGPSEDRLERFRHARDRYKALRRAAKLFDGGKVSRQGSRANRGAQVQAERYIAEVFADRPDLAKLMTPNYPFLGKRPVQSSEFYQALRRDNVRLVPRAVEKVSGRGPIDIDGIEHPVDAIVLATGFHASDFVRSVDVRGRSGRTLQDEWEGEPRAFLGVCVPDFPNFFMIYGPNTNATGALLLMQEAQASLIVSVLKSMRRRHVMATEVPRPVYERYHAWLDRCFRNSTFLTTHSYFTSRSGRVVTNWPRSVTLYRVALRLGRHPAAARSLAPTARRHEGVAATTAGDRRG